MLIAAGIAVVLVFGGVGAGLAITKTWPFGADGLMAAVDWDPDLRRFTADLVDGEKLSIDNDMGIAVTRDAVGKHVLEQQRAVRYVFAPLGDEVRAAEAAVGTDGAFDVLAPEHTAEDQMRYMVEVLEMAYEGRAMLKGQVAAMHRCDFDAGEYGDLIGTMQAVRDNRAELLDALDAMPVDQIPEGRELLDDLYEAIWYSHEANVEYVARAEAEDRSGCAKLSAAGQRAAEASDPPKERFASRWNRAVAPVFGVRTFEGKYI